MKCSGTTEAPYSRATPDGYALPGKAWASPVQMDLRLEVAKELSERAAKAGTLSATALDAFLPALEAGQRDALRAETDQKRRLMLFLGTPGFMYR